MYLGCSQLPLCVEHSVSSSGAGKEWERHLEKLKSNFEHFTSLIKFLSYFQNNLVAKYCGAQIQGGLQPGQDLRNKNLKQSNGFLLAFPVTSL